MPAPAFKREKVWHPVTRIWHWVFAGSVITGWCLGEFMSFDTVEWHFYTGYLILSLLLFRVVWGLFGPEQAALSKLLPSLSSLIGYLKTLTRREPSGLRGHNPLGALSVLVMILIIGAQATTGLFMEADDFFEAAPLAQYVSSAAMKSISWWHHFLSSVILVLVCLHVAAVLFYLLWKKENLISAMITGWKQVRDQ